MSTKTPDENIDRAARIGYYTYRKELRPGRLRRPGVFVSWHSSLVALLVAFRKEGPAGRKLRLGKPFLVVMSQPRVHPSAPHGSAPVNSL
jgi:hypothetical protein